MNVFEDQTNNPLLSEGLLQFYDVGLVAHAENFDLSHGRLLY